MVSKSHVFLAYCTFIFNGRTEKTPFKNNEAEKFFSAGSFWFAHCCGTSFSLQVYKLDLYFSFDRVFRALQNFYFLIHYYF